MAAPTIPTTKMHMIKDDTGAVNYAQKVSNAIVGGKLVTANLALTVPTPTGDGTYANYTALISASNDVWIAVNTTAAIPTGAPAWGSSVLNRAEIVVNSGDTISIISSTADTVFSVEFLLNAVKGRV